MASVLTVDEALHSMPERSKASQREVCNLVGMSESALSRKLSRFDEGAHLHVAELTPVMNGFKDWTPLHVLCRINGGLFVQMPKGKAKKALKPSDFNIECSRLVSLLIDFYDEPSQEKYDKLDSTLQDHVQSTANIRAHIKTNINQAELDL